MQNLFEPSERTTLMNSNAFLIALSLCLTLSACGKDKPEAAAVSDVAAPPPVAVEQLPLAEGEVTGELQSGYDIYVAKCINCHGDIGQGVGDNPKLAGLTRIDVSARLRVYRDGKTLGPKTAIMAPAATGLSDGQILALAYYVGE